jgi:hypothetical protein
MFYAAGADACNHVDITNKDLSWTTVIADAAMLSRCLALRKPHQPALFL